MSLFPPAECQSPRCVRIRTATAIDKVLPPHAEPPKLSAKSSPPSQTNRFLLPTAPNILYGSCRSISTGIFSLAKNDDGNCVPSKQSLDAFRTNEENIEREFQHKQKEDETSSGPQSQRPQIDQEDERIQEVRCRILDAALPFVHKQGWSREAISSGAETCGYPSVVHGMFPNGGAELIQHFYMKCNRQLIEQLKSEEVARPTEQAAPVPTEFIARSIKLRLQMIEPYVETWPKALAVMTLPQNAPTSLAQLLTLVDDICYYAGDRSVDVSILVPVKKKLFVPRMIFSSSLAGIYDALESQLSTKRQSSICCRTNRRIIRTHGIF